MCLICGGDVSHAETREREAFFCFSYFFLCQTFFFSTETESEGSFLRQRVNSSVQTIVGKSGSQGELSGARIETRPHIFLKNINITSKLYIIYIGTISFLKKKKKNRRVN